MADPNAPTRRYERMPCPSCGQTDYDELYKPTCHVAVCRPVFHNLEAVAEAARSVRLNHEKNCECGLCKALKTHDALLEKERQVAIAWNDAKTVLPTHCRNCGCIHRPHENSLCTE